MATGVLLIGVGNGTKHLQTFLKCTKEYEATVLFGIATDTYDILGEVLETAPYGHLNAETVEMALHHFRGEIMQRPPLYSALRIQGKRLYEYAREGKELPAEIEERPVEVKELELIKWINGHEHNYEIVSEEVGRDEKILAEKVLRPSEVAIPPEITRGDAENNQVKCAGGRKRKGDQVDDDNDNGIFDEILVTKLQGADPQFTMARTPQTLERGRCETANTMSPLENEQMRPPAVKLRMTVTSGFYVRSLSHDLGKLLGSLGSMSDLVRTRQGDFRLGHNVLEYSDFSQSEEVWAPKVECMLEEWEESILGDDRKSKSC